MNQELIDLYKNTSKHSNYQILPNVLKPFIGENVIQTINRYEMERWQFVNEFVDFKGKKVLDVGGNTGFFSFESIEAGADEVYYYEGNTAHAKFVNQAATLLQQNILTTNQYVNFKDILTGSPFDIALLFNVIHHLGDDFGHAEIAMVDAKREMQKTIMYFYDLTEILVLQIGFCWKGDRNQPLFENGTKQEMIDFVNEAIDGKWSIEAIGIASIHGVTTHYSLLNTINVERDNLLGEFRNRPIFILKRK
jgi:2-polyprenyl-3-methyl-5-hydroxy-6-metoxy-1,4-benzoquinol methylase